MPYIGAKSNILESNGDIKKWGEGWINHEIQSELILTKTKVAQRIY